MTQPNPTPPADDSAPYPSHVNSPCGRCSCIKCICPKRPKWAVDYDEDVSRRRRRRRRGMLDGGGL